MVLSFAIVVGTKTQENTHKKSINMEKYSFHELKFRFTLSFRFYYLCITFSTPTCMTQEHKSHGSNQQVTTPVRFVKRVLKTFLQGDV